MSYLSLYLKGIFIGIANVIPGVSGGTVAFLMGIYKSLLNHISHFRWLKTPRSTVLYLSVVTFGVLSGIFLFSKLFTVLIIVNPWRYSLALVTFLGLIFGSLPSLLKTISEERHKPPIFFPSLFFLLALFLMAFLAFFTTEGNQELHRVEEIAQALSDFKNLFRFLLIAFIASGAMILPGISGSALQLSLGTFEYFLFITSHPFAMPYVTVAFGLVFLLGLAFFARLINYFLQNHFVTTLFFSTGLVLGSSISLLQTIWSMHLEEAVVWNFSFWIFAVILFILGMLIAQFSAQQKRGL